MQEQFDTVATPKRGFAPLSALLSGRALPALLARLASKRAGRKGRPLTLGKRVLVVRHADVSEMLRRDLDFIIAPINASRIEAVNGGPFILGMDRSPTLMLEREALYRALAEFDLSAIATSVDAEARSRIAAAGSRFDAISDYARPIAAATARQMFGIKPDDERLFAEAIRAIFAHTFLNLGGDAKVEKRAVSAGALMRTWFAEEIGRRRAAGEFGTDLMGILLRQGKLDDDGVRRTLGGMLVGSIDTTASAFAKIFCVIASDPALRAQLLAAWQGRSEIYGLCLDALRRWPHNPIVLRQAAADTTLGGVSIAKGATVIAWTQAAMQDSAAFPDPERMLPDRPMAAYLHFGAGLHPCAGRAVNAIQIPALIGTLLEHEPERCGRMGWAGPFPNSLPVALRGGIMR